jgi:dihydrofolate synthase/folylpolyglutamate synthase
LFTSPHLVHLNERIQINSKLISDLDLAKYIDKVCIFEKENEIVLGYFESIFLIAASYFLDSELDVFIVEAGIGGRLDTTSILNSQIVCLTNVDLDHTELLGNSIEDILFEKIKISQNVKCFILGSNKIHRQYESIIKEELNIDDKNYELSF